MSNRGIISAGEGWRNVKRIFLLLLIISAFVWLTGCFSVLRTQEVTSTLVPGASSEPEFTQDASVEEIRFRGLEWGIDSAAATDFLNSDSEISQTFIADNTAIPVLTASLIQFPLTSS